MEDLAPYVFWNDCAHRSSDNQKTKNDWGFTFRYKSSKIRYKGSETNPMTDYSTAIFGLIAFTAVVSAAVVYILAQPSDLPVVKKAKASQS